MLKQCLGEGVLELAAEKSGWANRTKAPERGMGIAAWFCHLSYYFRLFCIRPVRVLGKSVSALTR
jgi:hypothetical protein